MQVGKGKKSPYLIGGVWGGGAGWLTFLVIHALWIRPIWFIAPIGLVIAGLGGLAVGWSYAEIHSALPPRPWTFLAITALIALILAPSILLAQMRPPLIDPATFSLLPQDTPRVIVHYIAELIVTAIGMGAVSGWLLGRSRQATIATAIAGLVYALGPGHNIPALGNTPAVGQGLVLLLAITLVSAFVLMEVSARLLKN